MEVDYTEEIKNYPVWIVEFSDIIIGGLILTFENVFATIANIAIHPDYQGKGIGRELITFTEDEVRKKGYNEIRLTTHILLSENISYYLKLGWRELERDKDRVFMSKIIG